MAVRKIPPKKSVQKNKTARRSTNGAKVAPARTVSKVKKVQYKGGKRPTRRTGGLIGWFRSDRAAGEVDYTFMLLVGVLVAFGLIMLLSASTPTADVKFGRSYHFFLRQFVFVVLGAILMFGLSYIDYRKWKPYARKFMILCLVLLGLVFIPGIGVEHNGSRRWINLVVMEFQPSELAKLAVSMFFAALVEDKIWDVTKKDGLIKYGMWIGAIAALMLAETHLSGTIVLCGIAVCILLVAGASLKPIFIAGGTALAGLGLFAYLDPVRSARITSFLNPFADKQASGYQTVQSLYAIGSGGIFGKGLGESVQKFSYLPEPYNDFIFAVTCEELGLIGAAFIIALFAGLIIRGFKIATEADDVFGSLMVVGIMAQVSIQTILNIAVATSSMPNTGVSLPFFSYGGTAIMILLAEMGIVLSVSRYSGKRK